MTSNNGGESESIQCFKVTYDEQPPSHMLLKALFAIENVDPVEDPDGLGFLLHDYVSPTALDRMFASCSTDLVITFSVAGYEITVDDEEILIVESIH